MPEFIYAGQLPASYAETRDGAGFIVGTVEHGDTVDFEGGEKPEGAPEFWPAPDGRWVPKGTKIADAWPGVGAAMYREGDGDAAAGDNAEPEPDPAPAAKGAKTAAAGAPATQETGAVAHLDGTSGEEH